MKVYEFLIITSITGLILGFISFMLSPSSVEMSREAQQCQLEGEELGCIQYSAWSLGKHDCSCVIPSGHRIEYTRDER